MRKIVVASLLAMTACNAPAAEPRFEKDQPKPVEAPKPAPVEQPKAEQLDPTAIAKKLMVIPTPSAPDPEGGKFDLAKATAGLAGKGKQLHATIDTSQGTLECDLFSDKAPLTVANFVGLARGVRPFWDARENAWVKRPLFDGTTFHRVIAGFMIQGGDHMGNGTGEVGYYVPDELHPSLAHDRPGLMAMANKGPNTNGGQFFITDAATPHLTQMKTYSIFGECKPVDVVHKIANVPKAFPGSEQPATPVVMKSVRITRR